MEFLRELFSEPLSFEAFSKAVQEKGIKLADLSTGKYADKDKLNKANGDLKTANETIKTLRDEMQTLKDNNASAEDWKKKFEDLTADIEAKEEAAKKEAEDKALTDAITAVFGEKKFTSDYVRNGIIADMKVEIAKPENKGKGYTELFEAITKDKEGIFANLNPPANMTGMGKVDPAELDDAQARAVMGLPPLKS
ncbi:MAG: phage scaffolding protein [Clostridia bacterium]|nr:phage scaffolding protein [Clostridia bacterium]